MVLAARELALEVVRPDLTAPCVGRGRFRVVAVNKARIVVQLGDCGLPVLVQSLQRGATEAGVPIGDTGEEQQRQGEPGQHIAPNTKLSGVRSEPWKCPPREVDTGIATARGPGRTVQQPA